MIGIIIIFAALIIIAGYIIYKCVNESYKEHPEAFKINEDKKDKSLHKWRNMKKLLKKRKF